MNIPSNFTLEEVLKYSDIDDKTSERLYKVLEQLNKQVKTIEQLNKRVEILEDEIYFRTEFIEKVIEFTKTTTKHKDLVECINKTLENSYIEL